MTKAITSGIIAGAGDLTCQFIVQQRTFYTNIQNNGSVGINGSSGNELLLDKVAEMEKFHFEPDLVRFGRFTFLGFALIAPVVHVSLKMMNEYERLVLS